MFLAHASIASGKYRFSCRFLCLRLGASSEFCQDVVAATHCDRDHVNGLFGVLDAVSVETVWVPPDPACQELIDHALSVGAQVQVPGDRLWPYGEATGNHGSLVLEVGPPQARMLLTGDIDAAAEAALQVGSVAVLKVAHHGSRTSTSAAFLDRISPRVAVEPQPISRAATPAHSHTTRLVLVTPH